MVPKIHLPFTDVANRFGLGQNRVSDYMLILVDPGADAALKSDTRTPTLPVPAATADMPVDASRLSRIDRKAKVAGSHRLTPDLRRCRNSCSQVACDTTHKPPKQCDNLHTYYAKLLVASNLSDLKDGSLLPEAQHQVRCTSSRGAFTIRTAAFLLPAVVLFIRQWRRLCCKF